MPDLLLELFSEEIPARMQRRGAEDLKRLVTEALVERGFLYEGARTFATPRRLAVHVAGLPAKIESDPKKGEFYVAVIERPGRATPEVLAEILPGIVRNFPWPKSMRWGAASREPGS